MSAKRRLNNLAMEIKNPIKNDEEMLKRLTVCDKFKMENNEEFIKSLYFYNELRLLHDKYVKRDQNDVPFSLELRDLTVEKIVELVGSILTDEHSSSDEDSESIEIVPLLHETHINDERLPHQYKGTLKKLNFDDIVFVSPEKKLFCFEGNLYHLSESKVNKLVECVTQFIYVRETDEIMYSSSSNRTSTIYRQPASTDGSRTLLYNCGREKLLCVGHDVTNYLTILTEKTPSSLLNIVFGKKPSTDFTELSIHFIDEIGYPLKPGCSIKRSKSIYFCRFKTCLSSFVEIRGQSISVKRGFSFEDLFSYYGRIRGCFSNSFFPSDVCTDPDGNYLVTNSLDNTVHLLDTNGDFLRILMSTEDGLSDIKRIALDTFGWLWVGCKDGAIHYANYQYFKSTTRQDRYLEKKKMKENALKES